MNYKKRKNIWITEEQHAFQGWDFSHLQSRWQSEPLPWDYKAIVRKYLHPTNRLLDMGTGGGEFLLSLNHPHKNTAVTETWQPNIQLCLKNLSPLGIRVYPVKEDTSLPIAMNSFDIVINRHASYNLHEVRRILKPGGIFITQQVGGENCFELQKRINLEKPTSQNFSMKTQLPEFQACGFEIKYANEYFPLLKFFDVGAVVFWAKTIVWSFPEFSVEKNFDKLCALQDEIDQKGFVSDLEHRFLIVAQNIK